MKSNEPQGEQNLSLELRVGAVCNRFEAAWRSGEPRIEEFLQDWSGAERLRLLQELVLLDIDYRRKRGDADPQDYLARFAELDSAWFEPALAGERSADDATAPHAKSGSGLDKGEGSKNRR